MVPVQLSPSYQYMYLLLEVLPKDEPIFFQLLGKLKQAAEGLVGMVIAYGVPLQSPLFQTHALLLFGQLPVPADAGDAKPRASPSVATKVARVKVIFLVSNFTSISYLSINWFMRHHWLARSLLFCC
jgi:hypothetical protein